jgi:hypothetical protein
MKMKTLNPDFHAGRAAAKAMAAFTLAGALGCAGPERSVRPPQPTTVAVNEPRDEARPMKRYASPLESEVVLAPPAEGETVLKATVIVFDRRQAARKAVSEERNTGPKGKCRGSGEGGVQAELRETECLIHHSTGAIVDFVGSLDDFTESSKSVKGAHISFEYFNSRSGDGTGAWSLIPGCEDLIAVAEMDVDMSSQGLSGVVPFYYAECDVAAVFDGRAMAIRASFTPRADQRILASSADYEMGGDIRE